MTGFPKISIVTTNFNQAAYLEDTILSILNQGYPNLEYIVIDGGSTDGSVEIIKKYSDRLAYWVSEPDKGMYDGLQKGFSRATGEIMAWINSDDMYLPKSLFSVAEIFSKFPQVNWLLGFPVIYDMQGRIVECSHTFRQWSKYDIYIGHYRWIQQESVFWRRSLWEKAGATLDTSLRYAGDFELWNRFFKIDRLHVTTALLSGFRMRTDQLSLKQRDAYEEEIASILAKNSYSKEENNIIQSYRKRKKQVDFLAKFKILNSKVLLDKFKLQHFGYPPVIYFNREKQCFEIG